MISTIAIVVLGGIAAYCVLLAYQWRKHAIYHFNLSHEAAASSIVLLHHMEKAAQLMLKNEMKDAAAILVTELTTVKEKINVLRGRTEMEPK